MVVAIKTTLHILPHPFNNKQKVVFQVENGTAKLTHMVEDELPFNKIKLGGRDCRKYVSYDINGKATVAKIRVPTAEESQKIIAGVMEKISDRRCLPGFVKQYPIGQLF